MNFKTWISKYKSTDNQVGDLARDILRDVNFPEVSDYQSLLNYLNNFYLHHNVIKIFKYAYKEYLKTNPQ